MWMNHNNKLWLILLSLTMNKQWKQKVTRIYYHRNDHSTNYRCWYKPTKTNMSGSIHTMMVPPTSAMVLHTQISIRLTWQHNKDNKMFSPSTRTQQNLTQTRKFHNHNNFTCPLVLASSLQTPKLPHHFLSTSRAWPDNKSKHSTVKYHGGRCWRCLHLMWISSCLQSRRKLILGHHGIQWNPCQTRLPTKSSTIPSWRRGCWRVEPFIATNPVASAKFEQNAEWLPWVT